MLLHPAKEAPNPPYSTNGEHYDNCPFLDGVHRLSPFGEKPTGI